MCLTLTIIELLTLLTLSITRLSFEDCNHEKERKDLSHTGTLGHLTLNRKKQFWQFSSIILLKCWNRIKVDFPEYMNEITQVIKRSNRWALKDIWLALALLTLNYTDVKINREGIHWEELLNLRKQPTIECIPDMNSDN